MDVRKTIESAPSDLNEAPEAAPERSSAALATALRTLAPFSIEFFNLTDSEAIRASVTSSVRKILGVETADLFYSRSETTEESIHQVFETGLSRIQNRTEGDAECIVAARGSLGILAVIRVTGRTDWSPFTMDDLSILESLAIQLGLRLENLRLTGELTRHQASSVQALAAAIEVKDRYTSGHTKRVGFYADAIVGSLPIIESEKEKIRLAGVLHDIGKIGVPDRILLKPDRLTEAEWDEMRLHTEAGFDIVSRVAGLEEIAEILRHHHERWDGSGYPRGLKADEIPFASRVIAVADTFDAIVTDRPYRGAMLPSVARTIIVELSGMHFDPVVVAAFEEAFPELEAAALGYDENS